jgi:phosphoglucosamine mutase
LQSYPQGTGVNFIRSSDDGRVLVRASGTEPVVRIMVEASSEALAKKYVDRLTEATRMSLGME